MSRGFRLLDTGVLRAAENLALNRALLDAHQANESPHTLRFLRFRPSALLGFHQSAEQELDLDYCRANGIDLQRRITGGGAIYFDEGQLGWELYLDRAAVGSADMDAIARRICEAAARGISRLGVDARYRPRNDIEVNGRKVSGTGGTFEGDSFMYQGTLLLDFDVERMVRALKIPEQKLIDKAVAQGRERVVGLRELTALPPLEEIKATLAQAFAQELGVVFEPGDLNGAERGRWAQALAEMDSEEWVGQIRRPFTEAPSGSAVHRSAGGLLRAQVRVDLARGILKQAWLTGDLFVSPRRTVFDLEAALKEVPIETIGARIEAFFSGRDAQLLRLEAGDFTRVIELAIADARTRSGSAEQAKSA